MSKLLIVNHHYCRRNLTVFLSFTSVAMLMIVIAGCEDNSPTQSSSGVTATTQATEISDSSVATSTAVQANSNDSMGGLIKLTRNLDYWYSGKKRSTSVRLTDNNITDDAGNTLDISESLWLGMIELVSSTNAANGQPMLLRTAPAWRFPNDGLGEIDRYVYEISILDDDQLRFNCLRKYEEN